MPLALEVGVIIRSSRVRNRTTSAVTFRWDRQAIERPIAMLEADDGKLLSFALAPPASGPIEGPGLE